mgnify:FL=1
MTINEIINEIINEEINEEINDQLMFPQRAKRAKLITSK